MGSKSSYASGVSIGLFSILVFLTLIGVCFNWTYKFFVASAGIVDLYVLIMLITFAAASDGRKWGQKGVINFAPKTAWSVLLMFIQIAIIIISFAQLLYAFGLNVDGGIRSFSDSFYYSFYAFMTVGSGSFAPTDFCLRTIIMFEIFSSVIVLFGGFALLVSRLGRV